MSVTVSQVRAPASSTGRTPGRAVLGVFALMAALLTVVVTIGQSIQGPSLGYLDGPTWLDGWSEGTPAGTTTSPISGYFYTPGQQSSIAFFPSYPLAVRALGDVIGGDFQIAGSALRRAVRGGLRGACSRSGSGAGCRAPARSPPSPSCCSTPTRFFLYGAMYSDSLLHAHRPGRLRPARAAVLLAGRRGRRAGHGRSPGRSRGRRRAGGPHAGDAGRGHSDPLHSGTGLADPAAGAPAGSTTAASSPSSDIANHASPTLAPAAPAAAGRRSTRRQWMHRRPPRHRQAPAGRAGAMCSPRSERSAGARPACWCPVLASPPGASTCGVRFGDPVAFATVQEAPGWYQGSGPHTWFKVGLRRHRCCSVPTMSRSG